MGDRTEAPFAAAELALYLVLDPRQCAGRAAEDVARAAAAGGVTLVQLRDKEATAEALVATARAVGDAIASFGVRLLINDRVDAAIAAGAGGVHLGQSDMTPVDARRLLGADAVIGLTVRSLEQARAIPDGVDYVSIGGVFPTTSKHNPDPKIGIAGLARITAAVSGPKVAISGIDQQSAASVMRAGVDGIAVSSAICSAADPEAAARELAAIVGTVLAERGDA